MGKKILITFFVFWFGSRLYVVLHSLTFVGVPISIALLIDILLIILFCGYYLKLFDLSKFTLKKNIPALLKSCGLFITFFILVSPFYSSSVDNIISEVYDFSYVLISKDILVLNLREKYLYIIGSLLMAPIMEEIVYRGLLQEYLSRKKNPFWIIIVLPATLFTLMHFRLTNIYLLFLGGCLYGFIYNKYRNVSINIICHSLWNLLVLLFVPEGQLSFLFITIYILSGISFVLLLYIIRKDTYPIAND